MSIYKPTWLYIKKHNQTGLKYFGKTIRDPFMYKGSGVYWREHLAVHGHDVTTIWCHLYFDKKTLVEEALSFSKYHHIVSSVDCNGQKVWANARYENGLDGGHPGRVCIGKPHTQETKDKISKIRKGTTQSQETKDKRAAALKGRVFTEEHLSKLRKPKPPRSKEHSLHQSIARKGKPWSENRRKAQEERRSKLVK